MTFSQKRKSQGRRQTKTGGKSNHEEEIDFG